MGKWIGKGIKNGKACREAVAAVQVKDGGNLDQGRSRGDKEGGHFSEIMR